MIHKHALILTLGAALAAPVIGGCTIKASGQAKAGGEEEPAPPPPPPPPPAAEQPAEQPKEAPKPKSAAKVDAKGKISIPGNIVFDTGKATLKQGAGSEVVLEQLKAYLDENPRVTKVRVEGHTDNVGKPEDNVTLSGNRALTIKNWLIGQGVKKERILAVGFGETKPIADNSTDAGKAQNRRTEFHIGELDGKAYLGMDPTRGGKVFE